MRTGCNLSQSTVFYQNCNTISRSLLIARAGCIPVRLKFVLLCISGSFRSVDMSRVCLLSLAALVACTRAYEGERHTFHICCWLSQLILCFGCFRSSEDIFKIHISKCHDVFRVHESLSNFGNLDTLEAPKTSNFICNVFPFKRFYA